VSALPALPSALTEVALQTPVGAAPTSIGAPDPIAPAIAADATPAAGAAQPMFADAGATAGQGVAAGTPPSSGLPETLTAQASSSSKLPSSESAAPPVPSVQSRHPLPAADVPTEQAAGGRVDNADGVPDGPVRGPGPEWEPRSVADAGDSTVHSRSLAS
jgi:hypothetical protein